MKSRNIGAACLPPDAFSDLGFLIIIAATYSGLEAGTMVNPNRMDDNGPGDITPAFLEPGEFVMTRPATQVLGARNLYKLMKDAERMA